MIEVRIDIDWMQKQQHNILHSILMMDALRAAGMPIIGKIVFNGPERGTLVQHRENTLDGDDWVVRWYDEDETPEGVGASQVAATGMGKGYSWVRYSNPKKLDRRYLLLHSESDSYVEVFAYHEAEKCMNDGCDDVTDRPEHEAAFKAQKEEEEW